LITIIPYSQGRLAILINVYFFRLKTKHDSHEFILEFGTVANSLFLTSAQARLDDNLGRKKDRDCSIERKGKGKGIKSTISWYWARTRA
jgi:hypothetical protein